MSIADKYSGLSDEYRDNVLAAINKPASERTAMDQRLIEMADELLALKSTLGEAKRQVEIKRELEREMADKILALESEAAEAKREYECQVELTRQYTIELLDTWEKQSREYAASQGWEYGGREWRNAESCRIEPPDFPAAELLESVVYTKEVIAKGYTEHAVLRGLWLARSLIKSGQGAALNVAISHLNRTHAGQPRLKPLLGTRAIAIAWQAGHRDAASIRGFFDGWRGKIMDDEWGGVSLDADEDESCWELIDEGGKRNRDGDLPSKTIKFGSLASMVSRFKKQRHPAE